MSNKNRPLSPHLQIYRPQLTSVLSILHRASGIILALGALLIAWWFWTVTLGPSSYAIAHTFFNSFLGLLLLFVWTLCTFYHLCNGIRHLVWDAGYALEIEQAYFAGKLVAGVAVFLTLLVWIL